ncbi:MAG: recombinase family protein [Candidatus Levybacteria bacterium]|nr:recombinase family protein [Candidatus Levybacteria bacterium]
MKYILYTRKSTDEKDRQILSIEAQVAELTEFAKRENLEIVEFISEAKTAKIPGREKFDLVLKKIEKGEASGIISWHPDRLARNSIDGGKIIYLLDTGKLLDLKFPSHWFENTPQGKFMLSIAFSQSKYYIDNLSENVKRGLRQKLRNGVLPSKAPWGYKNNEKLGTIEIDEVKSRILKKAFELFANGNKSFTDILTFLFKNGFTDKNGKPLKIDRLKNALSNKFYIGIIFFAGEYYEGKHKLFISKTLFDQVQKQFRLRERSRPNNKHNLSFLGLMKCGECRASITGEMKLKFYKGTQRKADYTYYSCTKKLGNCLQKPITEPKLEPQIEKIITDVALPKEWADDWYKWLERDEMAEKQLKEENLMKLDGEIKTLDQKLNFLLDSYLDNVIDADIYKKKKNELFEEKLRKQEEITKLQTNGSGWLEPFREFIGDALSCGKIARAKNTNEELAFFAKTVGSDFFLTDRQLFPVYNRGFAELYSGFSSPSPQLQASGKSHSERETGIGPAAFSLKLRCYAHITLHIFLH